MALYAFDGTWNTAAVDDGQEGEHDTNVVHFYETYGGRKWYVPGPGTRLGRLGKALGGFAGMGASMRLQEGYKQLRKDYEAGERVIDIVGFSRGAAIALDFANLIRMDGIWNEETGEVVATDVPIRFLGLWDVVGSFGIPIGQLIFQRFNLGHKLTVPDNVEYAFHALAMDDCRQTFRPTRQLNAYEVWFRGVHSDVGGGNGNAGLACIALRWMLYKAKAAGLPIDDAAIHASGGEMDPHAPLCPPTDFIRDAHREFWPNDRVHYTVTDRPDHNNAPADCPRESKEDERVAVPVRNLERRQPPAPPAPPIAEPDPAGFPFGD